MILNRDNFTGPWAGLPVAWTENDEFDENVYRGDVARCCGAGIPGVYSGGTTGEFYAMEFDEFQAVARATVEATCEKIRKFDELLESELPSTYTDTAYDRIGGIADGFLQTSLRSRGPYPMATQEDVEVYRRLYAVLFS